jgi:phage shock protein E
MMINSLKKILGLNPKTDYKSLYNNKARIIDVRTKKEYASGHIRESINIPLNELNEGIRNLDKDQVIITCCASGVRSASAKTTLTSLGYKKVYNGGGWTSLNSKIKKP